MKPAHSAMCPGHLASCRTKRICTPLRARVAGVLPWQGHPVLRGHRGHRPIPPHPPEHGSRLPQPSWLRCLSEPRGGLEGRFVCRDGARAQVLDVVCIERPKAGGKCTGHSGVCPVTCKSEGLGGGRPGLCVSGCTAALPSTNM